MAEPTDLEILEGPPLDPPPLEHLSPSWLVATGQDHHLRRMMLMTFGGAALAALGWLAGMPALHMPPLLPGLLAAAGALLVCGGLLLTIMRIRCAACGLRVGVHFIRHANFSSWMRELQAATGCPRCGDHPAAREPQREPPA